jgi:phosphoglycerate dehydrogenase-like enzyme
VTARVLITEPVDAPLEPLGALEIDHRPEIWCHRGELLQAVGACAALVVRARTRVDRELLGVAPRLQVVGRLGVGVDNLDLDALRERKVAVAYAAGINARSVGEYVIGAALDLARGLARADRNVRAGRWERPPAFELRGRTIGIVGLGATGSAVARLARALGMRVVGFDPLITPAIAGLQRMALDDVLSTADMVTLHVPLIPQTRKLIGARELSLFKSGAVLINASRGGVIDETALLEALRQGRLGGAALDVREHEPPPLPDPFAGLDQVLLTPHVAGRSAEAEAAVARSVLTDVRRILEGKEPRGPVIR